MRDQNYFALDLELNNKNDGSVPKIIEVGAAIGSPIRPNEIIKHRWCIDPGEPITPFITQLTGIDDDTIRNNAVSHEVVAEELGELLTKKNCFSNPVTWGQGDADELKEEFRQREIDFPFFGRRIFDVKTIYVYNQIVAGRSPSGGLRKAMGTYGLPFVGTPHRAYTDAFNTLLFFFHLLERQKKFEDFRELMRETK